jgi:parallel beta-helix repeat protein
MKALKALTCFALITLALFVCAGRVQATDISGTITSTITITQDSQLVSDVRCAVSPLMPGANPCIAFGLDHIKLRLNGHTITGPADPPTGCSVPGDGQPFTVGIEANGRTDVEIEGPGIIQEFGRWGILLLSSTDVTVRRVTANRNCWSGLQTVSTSDSNFEEDTWVNNAAGSNGAPCGGICLSDSSKNTIRKCAFYGNGSLDYAGGNVDFGVGFEGASSENRVESNNIGGNTNGVFVVDDTATGNIVRHNTIAGNPPGQVLKAFTASNQAGFDIHDNASAGANTFEDNFCLTYSSNALTAPCPNVRTEGNDGGEAARRLTIPSDGPKGSVSATASLLANPDQTPNRKRGTTLVPSALLSLALVFTTLRISSSRSRNRSKTAR